MFLFTPRLCCERTSGHGNISDSGRRGNPCGRPPWRGGCGWLVTAPEKRAFLGRGCLESRHRVSYVELHCTDSWFLAQRRVCKGLPGPSPAPWHPRPLFTVVWEGRSLRGSWRVLGDNLRVLGGLGGLGGSWKILGGLGGPRGVVEDSVLGDAEVPRPEIWVKWQQHHRGLRQRVRPPRAPVCTPRPLGFQLTPCPSLAS